MLHLAACVHALLDQSGPALLDFCTEWAAAMTLWLNTIPSLAQAAHHMNTTCVVQEESQWWCLRRPTWRWQVSVRGCRALRAKPFALKLLSCCVSCILTDAYEAADVAALPAGRRCAVPPTHPLKRLPQLQLLTLPRGCWPTMSQLLGAEVCLSLSCSAAPLQALLGGAPNPAPMHWPPCPASSPHLPPARWLLFAGPLCNPAVRFSPPDAAGDEDEVASTSSSSPYLGPSPTTKLGADTGAAQAVRELKAKPSRSGVPAQDEQPAPDAVQMEAAAAQDAEPPAGDAVPVQVNFTTNRFWLNLQRQCLQCSGISATCCCSVPE